MAKHFAPAGGPERTRGGRRGRQDHRARHLPEGPDAAPSPNAPAGEKNLAPREGSASRTPAAPAGDAGTSDVVGRSAAMMSALVIVSRITGFVRTWAQAYALGTTLLASCYTVANNLPNQLYELVMGGMLVTAFLPVYLGAKRRAGQEGANRYISNLLSIVLLLMGVLAVGCVALAAPLVWVQSAGTDQSQMVDAVFLFRFFAVEVVLYCLSTVASGVLNAERDYFWSSAAPIFNNLITISSFALYAVVSRANPAAALLVLGLGHPLGVLVQVLVQLPSLRRRGVRLTLRIDLRDPALRETLAIGVPSLVVTLCSFVTVAVMNSSALVAVPEQGSSIQYYARLWYTLPYSIFAIPITTALFTELSSLFADADLSGFAQAVVSGMRQILFVLVPFMLYLMVFARPLMTLMRMGQFGAESAQLTSAYLTSLAVALPFYGLTTFFQKVFSSMRRMVLFAIANVVASVAQVAFTVALTPVIGIHAVSLGSALCAALIDVVSVIMLRRSVAGFGLRGIVGSAARSLALGALGAAVGAGILWGLTTLAGPADSPARALAYVAAGGLPALAATFGAAIALGVPEAAFYARALSRVTGRLRRG
ncbi:murein biosynthesis integral membrane protein MurJ [Olsenella sp. An290]|uniref:murein biosynthesis integral membrane protein MurJ n=1 Tax=Olsenella sp. An290 TaxID=1965625 RepID=UPI000B389888|nr:murein biosynthesis integral membrane protein MurJ [Olsenella sp. An290]OUO35585.1 hypothetical protein B5F84_02480 [Olsenella sp. An290]